MHLQLRTDDDHRTGRIVDTLTQKVLTEAALLALKAVGKRLERTVGIGLDGRRLAAVVEQRIDCLLKHALLVAEYHLGRLDLDQALQTVVADDHAAIEVVEIRRGETAAVERHQRTQLGRDHRHGLKYHPLGLVAVAAGTERFNDLEALESLGLALLRTLAVSLVAERVGQRVEVDALQQIIDGLGAHPCDELVGIAVVEHLVLARELVEDVEILLLAQQIELL